MKIAAWVIGVPAVLLLLFLAVGLLSGPPTEKDKKRAAIALCWEEQGRKSLEPGVARFVAGACEQMERDFVAAYGNRP